MLVLVRAYPGRAVELIKYLQIINRTEVKFKGLTWFYNDEQFHRCTAHDLSLNWGLVDLELWTRPSRSRVRLNLIASSVTAPSPKTYLLTYWMCVICSQSSFCATFGVTLRSSKTDSFRLGQSLIIARTASQICAVTTMQHYFPKITLHNAECAAHPSRPLFSFQFGRLLTRSAVISLLRDIVRLVGLPFHSLKGHTFRIGAASTAAAVGLPDWLIKIMGRWSSDCHQLCIGTTVPRKVLLSAAPRMANVTL